jgi:hypothetical protein
MTPSSGSIQVIQQGAALTFRTSSGDATGNIDGEGNFIVVANIPLSAGCPIGVTCANTTRGRFTIGQTPMTFTGTGEIILSVTGTPFCTVTYQTSGERTSCETRAAQAAPRSVWLDRWRQILGLPAGP